MSDFPNCPLCGRSPCGIYGDLWCPDTEDNECPLSRMTFTSEQWRRLAAPFEILRRAHWGSHSNLYMTEDDALALKKSLGN